MPQLNVYLTFDGNCEEAFNFYKSVFNTEFMYINRFGDMPIEEGAKPIAEEDKDKVMHVSLQISEETVLMGSDGGEMQPEYVKGNNFSLSVNTESREEAERIFSELSAGGEVIMPLADTFWGAYFGMWIDKFGIAWMVNYDDPAKVKPH